MGRPSTSVGRGRSRAVIGFICGVGCAWAASFLAGPSNAQQPKAAPATQSDDAEKARLAAMTARLLDGHREIIAARAELIAVSLNLPKDESAIAAKAKSIGDAELHFAQLQADAVGQQQKTAALKAAVDRGKRIVDIPDLTCLQSESLTVLTGQLTTATAELSAARTALGAEAVAVPRDDVAIKSAVDAVVAAEVKLANIRADAFAKLQASANRLSPGQISALAAMGGALKLGGFTEPKPINFDDHEGYVSLFDGTTLKGWDGNPKFWRVENGRDRR